MPSDGRQDAGARPKRNGYVLGIVDFVTFGLLFLLYMPFGGLQNELEDVLGHPVRPYWQAYLLGIPTLFLYTLVWMARISEELRDIAEAMGIEGPHTSFWHMFGWNTAGVLLFGPAIATGRFFETLDAIEARREEGRLTDKMTGGRNGENG